MMLNLDLSQACLQLPVDESSNPFWNITHTRVYKTMYMSGYNRLPISVVKALPCVSEANGAVLQGIPGVACYIHDILFISADKRVRFSHLETNGFKLKLMAAPDKTKSCISHKLFVRRFHAMLISGECTVVNQFNLLLAKYA